MKTSTNYGLAFLAYGAICLITALVLSSTTGKEVRENIPASGGKFGPIITSSENEIVKLMISQSVSRNHWSSVAGEILDDEGNYLFAFEEELWFESGHDSDGYWEEAKTNYDFTVTFPEPGKYFVKLSSNKSPGANTGSILVKSNLQRGSSIPHTWLGCISLVVGVLILYFGGSLKGWLD